MKTLKAVAVMLLGMALAAPVGGDPVNIETRREFARSIAGLPSDSREIVRALAVRTLDDTFVPLTINLNNSGLMQSCIDQSPEPAFAETWCREAFDAGRRVNRVPRGASPMIRRRR